MDIPKSYLYDTLKYVDEAITDLKRVEPKESPRAKQKAVAFTYANYLMALGQDKQLYGHEKFLRGRGCDAQHISDVIGYLVTELAGRVFNVTEQSVDWPINIHLRKVGNPDIDDMAERF